MGGLHPCGIWQIDVTHVPFFGRLVFVHLCVDTYSHVICASVYSGEALRDVVKHLFYCFYVLGMLRASKIDNGLVCISIFYFTILLPSPILSPIHSLERMRPSMGSKQSL